MALSTVEDMVNGRWFTNWQWIKARAYKMHIDIFDTLWCERVRTCECVCLCSDACSTWDGNLSALWRQLQLILSTYSPSLGPIVLTSLKNTLSHLVQTHQNKWALRKKETHANAAGYFLGKIPFNWHKYWPFSLRGNSTCIEAPNFVIYERYHAAASPNQRNPGETWKSCMNNSNRKEQEQIKSCSRLIMWCERVSKCMMRK